MTASTAPLDVSPEALSAVAEGRYHQPHEVLGAHATADAVTFRILRPLAEAVSIRTDTGETLRLQHEYQGVWVGVLSGQPAGQVPGYRYTVRYPGGQDSVHDDPYRYLPTLGEMDLHLLGEGRHEELWKVLGSRIRRYSTTQGEVAGASFALWAPHAQAVRVIGDFNSWDGRLHAMRTLGGSGVWELFIPDVEAGAVYKYQILTRHGQWVDRADPLARWTEVPPRTGSRVEESRYGFHDDAWMAARQRNDIHQGPMSIYEIHAGSWRPPGADSEEQVSYRQLADQLVEYVSWQGFTHVEFLPLAEHPFGGSWGYQVTGYYAPTSRFGNPDDLRYLIDRLHQAEIGVIIDWVPAHFPKDEWALANFDGEPLYEYADPRKGEHPDWGTKVFDYGRNEVCNFLVANALYWLEEFHIDGLRVDAVASMLYLDYSREHGQWVPNVHGGNHNLEAISFLQEVNATAYREHPGAIIIAEESTAFDGVTRATEQQGLGFGKKWNMGWMHDSLSYMGEDPINRVWHHGTMTFSMAYAYSERYVLPLSHDEVVHGKGSLLARMPGDRWQQLASLRAYYGYMWAHPGKKLLFMGGEFAQEAEWSEAYGLDWWQTENPAHKGVMKAVRDLNIRYRSTPALWQQDDDPAGFTWIDGGDSARNLFSFIRWATDGTPEVCIANFSGSEHRDVLIGLPVAGIWTETFNSDASAYGGAGKGNLGAVTADGPAQHDQPTSARITIPALTTLYLAPQKP